MKEISQQVLEYALSIDFLEFGGLVFGLLAVYFLIKDNIWTWPSGIIYVLISFVVFWKAKLYADFGLHIFFLVLNIYGWYYWITGAKDKRSVKLPITRIPPGWWPVLIGLSFLGILLMGWLLSKTDASVPYWDSATTVLSIFGMWLTARKKIENWHFWLVVNVLASGIYIYKEIYFYTILYMIYIGMAIAGYISWKRIMALEQQESGR